MGCLYCVSSNCPIERCWYNSNFGKEGYFFFTNMNTYTVYVLVYMLFIKYIYPSDHPEITFSETPGKCAPVIYSTYGACCTRVQIDCLTGDHKVRSK